VVVVPRNFEGEKVEWLKKNLGRKGLVTLPLKTGGAMTEGLSRPQAADTALIQYTSGSTGSPKGVQISHGGLVTNCRQMIQGLGITSGDVFVSWLPVCHDMGLILMAMVPFFLGLKLVLLPANLANLRLWLETMSRHRATFTAAPDTAYRLCLSYAREPEKYNLKSLRMALNAAEPVRATTVRKFEEVFGLDRVLTPAYGLAEATVGVCSWEGGQHILVDSRGFVSVGKPFPGIEIKIIRDGREARTGESGEILVKSPANTKGYLNNREANENLFWGKEYIRTGDSGYEDQNGNLYIVGRIKNIIIHSGQNISPREIEEKIDPLPKVRYSAAVGIDRGRIEGEQVYIFAEMRAKRGADRSILSGLHRRIVREFEKNFGFRPGRVYLVSPRTIPLTPNGKKQYTLLKEHYRQGQLRREGRLLFPDY
jgi:acyl-CoA synthetase (AMP-forming)/AMP-acid ligase II